MTAEHLDIKIVAAEPAQDQLIVYFSDGTTTLFQSHFLYEVRDDNGSIPLTNLSEDELLKGFGE